MSLWFINCIERSVTFPGPAGPIGTLGPLRRGRGAPCFQVTLDGAIWRTSRMASGPVAARITKSSPNVIDCEMWGDGAAEFADGLPALLGADDDAADFAPSEPTIAAAHRRGPPFPLGRTPPGVEGVES